MNERREKSIFQLLPPGVCQLEKFALTGYSWLWSSKSVVYRIYSNKRRGAYLIFRATSAALIPRRRLFKNCTRKICFFYIFIQRYTFYLLIFLWTDA